jgi:hypothetical protein
LQIAYILNGSAGMDLRRPKISLKKPMTHARHFAIS